MSIACGSQIVLCDCPIRIDTYKGCSHACKYCFVQRKTDISKIEKDNCVKQLRDFINGKRNETTKWCDWDIPLHWGGMSDPFQPCERVHRISYEVLKIFAETKYPFIVSTKGKLICDDEYLNLLKQCNAVVQISMVCSKYDVLERGAPKYSERLKMLKKLVGNCKRVVVRIQPYMTEVFEDVMESLDEYAKIGIYGITIEGMKFVKPKPGLTKVGGDFVYPKHILSKDYEAIKQKCHSLGLAFMCAENRLRTMGDSMTCCGCEGVEGFLTNKYNLEHIYNGEKVEATEMMKKSGTAGCFKAIYQNAGSSKFLRSKSFIDIMDSREVFDSYEPVIFGNFERGNSPEDRLKFTKWLKSTGIKAKEIEELTGTQMHSHWLCVQLNGQTEIPTPEMFERLLKSPKIKVVPNYIRGLVYGYETYKQKKYNEISKYK